jgi:prepilin-type N-terminal cleavage/methylation domain-containing protein
MTNRNRAFTLVELLIVVAIIAILAAIAVPNFMEAQVRSKVSRAKNDMRAMALALEAYRTDQNTYPDAESEFRPLRHLTTPIAYISSLPADPFPPKGLPGPGPNAPTWFGARSFRYGGMPQSIPMQWWILGSFGPDLQNDTPNLDVYPGVHENEFGGSPNIFWGGSSNPLFKDWAVYDPTNGTLSRGDIVRASDASL